MTKVKIYSVIGIIIVLLSMGGTIQILRVKLQKANSEKELYIGNTHNLLDTLQTYRTKDSLNVASVGKLELKLSELKKYRKDDSKLIQSLNVDKKKLENLITAQTKTIYALKGTVRDSIIYRDNFIVDTLRCITIFDKWFEMNGCIDKSNVFTGRFENRDSLAIINHVKQKRFLGFLWYRGEKENRIDVVSKNPNTHIQGVEYIEIRD